MKEYTVKNNDFTEFDSNPDLILDRIDHNNTHYYTSTRCPNWKLLNSLFVVRSRLIPSTMRYGKLNSLVARQLRADFLERFPANVSGGR